MDTAEPMSMTDSVTARIVGAVAEAKGVSPTDLDCILGEHVDADAIEQLVAHSGDAWELAFEFADHTVSVTGDGTVYVDGVRATPAVARE